MELPNIQKYFGKPKQRGINNYAQEIAREICEYFSDYKEFGLWTKMCQKRGEMVMKAKLEYVKEKNIKSPRYLLKICRL